MRRILIPLIALASLLVPAAAVGGPHGSGHGTACVFTTQLSATNETTGSTSTSTGHTQIKIRNEGTLEFKTHILNPDAETFVAGHVHNAPAAVAGPIVVPLFTGPATSDRHIVQTGTIAIAASLATAICAHPENYYVNYHTTAFPGGAIRGQLG
jgi:hypothetical protein